MNAMHSQMIDKNLDQRHFYLGMHSLKLSKPLWYVHSALEWDGTSTGIKWKVWYHVEMFTRVQDKDRGQDPLVRTCASPSPDSFPTQCE